MRWRLIGLVVLAVTAGCSSLTGTSTESPTVTPAPVPTASPTPDDPRGGLAPGLSASGVTQVGTLARAHVDAATEESYVWRRSAVATHDFGNSSLNSSKSQVVIFENRTTYHRSVERYETIIDGRIMFLEDYEEYRSGDVAYRKWTRDSSLTIEETDPAEESPTYANIAASDVIRFLELENETVSRIAVGEERHYEVVGTRDSLPRFGPLDAYQARAVVRADGFVRSLDVRVTATPDDERIEAHYNFTYRQVGNTTVTEPEWVPENETDAGDD